MEYINKNKNHNQEINTINILSIFASNIFNWTNIYVPHVIYKFGISI